MYRVGRMLPPFVWCDALVCELHFFHAPVAGLYWYFSLLQPQGLVGMLS